MTTKTAAITATVERGGEEMRLQSLQLAAFAVAAILAGPSMAKGGGGHGGHSSSGSSHSGSRSSTSTHSSGSGDHAVKGHFRKDGTYVQPHHATNPNETQRDNWTSKPNVNPYTGQSGTREPQR